MVALIWLINILSPFVTIAGLIGLAYGLDETSLELILWSSLGCFIVGFIFGIIAWKYDVPPRWFWVKSQVGLFETLIGSAFSYGLRFAFIPFAVVGIGVIAEAL